MSIDITVIIVFSAGGAAGGIIGYLARTAIEHRLAISRSYETIRATEFNKGAAEFRAAFTSEIYYLRKNIKNGNEFLHKIITDDTFVAHNKAKILFEPFVPSQDISAFDVAWTEYECCEHSYFRNCKTPFNPASIDSRKELSQQYLICIENLLNVAKPKINT